MFFQGRKPFATQRITRGSTKQIFRLVDFIPARSRELLLQAHQGVCSWGFPIPSSLQGLQAACLTRQREAFGSARDGCQPVTPNLLLSPRKWLTNAEGCKSRPFAVLPCFHTAFSTPSCKATTNRNTFSPPPLLM